jgi:2-dehydropantoate 2-reductase
MNHPKKVKVGIIGMGPVGMILAAKLKEAGCEVAICIRNHVRFKKIEKDGIELENVIESQTHFEHIFHSIADMAQLDLDYLVFAVKSYQTQEAVSEAEILNSEKLTVISAQNGIDVEQYLTSVFTEAKTLRMVVNFAGNMSSPNTVKVTFFTPPNYIGSVDDSRTEKAKIFSDLLNSVDLTTNAVNSFEMLQHSWEKTIKNASLSPLCGVGRLTMGEAMADPDTVELIEQTINEGIMVAEKENIRFPANFLRQCLRYLKKGGDHFPSLAGDIIKNRPTEIDFINGKLVEYGKKHYVRTTLNLAFTNMVKAMTNKNVTARIPGAAGDINKRIVQKGMVDKNKAPIFFKGQNCFLGVDLGSAFTKFTVIDNEGTPIFRYALPTLSKDRYVMKNVLNAIHAEFDIKYSCATGYGRKVFTETDIAKTEINCAAAGVSKYVPGEKNIIDIGGEDIKIVRCEKDNHIANFYMNDKCAAGTGSFLTEIAERAKIDVSEMSSLAQHSEFNNELNSFCTVFAKTEIMKWIMDGMSIQDIARGIYISIANKVAKMRLDPGVPTLMIGGVIAHHPYLKILLNKKFDMEIQIIDSPQFVVSLGAALIASEQYIRQTDLSTTKPKEIAIP